MIVSDNAISREDRITLYLSGLYESYGYGRYRMAKFEPYDFYMENKNFLKSEAVITFPDSTGKLMALKPDVTMSVVKNTGDNEFSKKVYYVENVFRMEKDTNEYREVRQIGLEFIGDEGFYPEAETVLLAAKSMELLSDDFVMCISHMDILRSVLDKSGIDGKQREKAMEAVSRKMPHRLAELKLDDNTENVLKNMIALPENAAEAIIKLKNIGICSEYTDELEQIYNILLENGFGSRVRIDFSIINDTHYYNGIAFVGYINGIPRDVLSGGRYDKLMQRFGKNKRALGFAVYLGALNGHFEEKHPFDADVLIIYGSRPADEVLRLVKKYVDEGKKVRAFSKMPDSFTARETIIL